MSRLGSMNFSVKPARLESPPYNTHFRNSKKRAGYSMQTQSFLYFCIVNHKTNLIKS